MTRRCPQCGYQFLELHRVILDFFSDKPVLTMKEIKQRLGGTVKPMTVHNAVSYLARKGCLTRIGWGKFRLNA